MVGFNWLVFAALAAGVQARALGLRRGATEQAVPGKVEQTPLLGLRGGAKKQAKSGKVEQPMTVEQPKTGKVWVTSTFTRDHVRFARELPGYLGAYINPFTAIDAKTIESVMLTVNSINACPYCSGLHGELARMSAATPSVKSPAVVFAKTFAEEGGRGAKVVEAFDKLVAAEGRGRAVNIRALCWMMLWGKTTGNSINAVRSKLLSGKLWKISPFEMLMFVYYGPLFFVIGVLNAGLARAPQVPSWFSSLFGAMLWVPQALHILPAALVCLVLRVIAAPFGGLDL